MAVEELDPRVLGWRLGRVESETKELAGWRRDVDKDREKFDGRFETLSTDMGELSKDLKAVKTMLVRFSFSIAGAAVTFAISVLIATGKI